MTPLGFTFVQSPCYPSHSLSLSTLYVVASPCISLSSQVILVEKEFCNVFAAAVIDLILQASSSEPARASGKLLSRPPPLLSTILDDLEWRARGARKGLARSDLRF